MAYKWAITLLTISVALLLTTPKCSTTPNESSSMSPAPASLASPSLPPSASSTTPSSAIPAPNSQRFVTAELEADIVISVADVKFYLHKVLKCEYVVRGEIVSHAQGEIVGFASWVCRKRTREKLLGKSHLKEICSEVFAQYASQDLLPLGNLQVAVLRVYNSLNKNMLGPHKEPPSNSDIEEKTKNLEIKKINDEKKAALAAQFAAEATLRRVYAAQKDDDTPPIEAILAPLEAELKLTRQELPYGHSDTDLYNACYDLISFEQTVPCYSNFRP
ncbi:hypothetical protein ZIOFF_015450 [Zingiber officinale]|uniref:Uncharacterized protein n=1 Tax=Zingiber officinale TaxID=94328 RepID=A0A8J5LTE8_ZINOF|nr:hypothetical protein ZIOFF_015450 [Zingiber officinale]